MTAVTVSCQVLGVLLPTTLKPALQRSEATLFVMACGAIISNKESLSGLCQAGKRYVTRINLHTHWVHTNLRLQLTNIVAFGAKGFHPLLVTPFATDYVQRVLVEGFPLQKSLVNLITFSNYLSRHSDVVHICPLQGTAKLYIWTHPVIRPWGQHLPPQCQMCGHVESWRTCKNTECSLDLNSL